MLLKKYITILLVAFLSISCSKDDSNIMVNNDIAGIWKLNEFTEDGFSITKTSGTETITTYNAYAKDIDAEVIFNSSKQFISNGNFSMKINYKINGQVYSEQLPVNDFFGSGKWKMENNVLIKTLGGENSSYEIINMNETNLKLQYHHNNEIINKGVSTKLDVTQHITFIRN